jgi:prepilin-type N-terminal cleavage/methylation domain-containing protein/prepilin-type processing-associated H-X9-DG protein
MKQGLLRRMAKAFTILELLVVIAILAILAAMVIPAITDGGCGSKADVCKSNLKQVGLGWLMYASDHADQFPWQVSTNSVLTRVVVESRPASEHFLALTNYLMQTPTFVCPTDEARTAATDYTHFSNSNLSYFAALSTTMLNTSNVSHLILSGDRHVSADGQPTRTGFHALEKSASPGWTKELHKPETDLTRGSLLFVDGHVQFTSSKELPKIFMDQPTTTTRLVIP